MSLTSGKMSVGPGRSDLQEDGKKNYKDKKKRKGKKLVDGRTGHNRGKVVRPSLVEKGRTDWGLLVAPATWSMPSTALDFSVDSQPAASAHARVCQAIIR